MVCTHQLCIRHSSLRCQNDGQSHSIVDFVETPVHHYCPTSLQHVCVVAGDVETIHSSNQPEGDLQRKMIPLRSVLTCGEIVDEVHDGHLHSPSSSSGLILVTSLIDRAPNLGGVWVCFCYCCQSCGFIDLLSYCSLRIRSMLVIV